jgi:3',5'-cyclic AMP phosphodiesterase CpdA
VRIALVGDIHVFAKRVARRRYFLSRRILGHTNLVLTRRNRFNHALLKPLTARLEELKPDTVLFSGDVTTTSLEDEFEDIARFIRPLAEWAQVVLVPGNHDRYTFGSRRVRRIETLMGGLIPEAFPHLRDLTERWRLLALDSAAPRVLSSSGELGRLQLEATGELLSGLTEDQGLVVLCHYPVIEPPLTPRHRTHDLREREALRAQLDECRARVLFLHGHIHKPWALLPGPPSNPPFTSINAGAPCMTSERFPAGQGFWEIELPDDPADAVRLTHHVPVPPTGAGPTGRKAIRIPPEDLNWEARQVV